MRAPKQKKPDFNIDTILKNPVDARMLKCLIDTALISKTKIDLENAAIADQRNEAKDKLGMPPAVFNKLVSVKHNQSLAQERAKMETTDTTLVTLYGENAGLVGPVADFDGSDDDLSGDYQ